jgi:radical SAM superfamily enzyme YgiQ (UPF0313 family)
MAYGGFLDFASVSPPIGLAYVAACLEKAGHQVTLIDSDPLGLNFEQVVSTVVNGKPDVVGLTGMTAMMDIVFDLAKAIKRRDKKIITVLGGVHGSALPVQTMEEEACIDILVKGEGETTAVELMEALDSDRYVKNLSDVKGICYREKGDVIENPPRPSIQDLDDLPFPAYHLLPMDKYRSYGWYAWINGIRQPYGSIHTSRGCPYKCTFCDANIILGRKYRCRSIENVMGEIDLLVNKYGIRSLRFEDETLTVKKDRAKSLCNALIKRQYHCEYAGAGRVNEIDEETLHLMKKANFILINYGVESGNDRVLDSINKNFTTEQVKGVFEMTEKAGLFSMASFIIGLPEDTRETCEETIKYARELKADYTGVACLIPFPGTEVYRYALDQGVPLPIRWGDYGQVNSLPIPVNREIGQEALVKLRRKAHYRLFLNPRYFFKIVRKYRAGLIIRDYLKMAGPVFAFFSRSA